jgi:hypothetical protein
MGCQRRKTLKTNRRFSDLEEDLCHNYIEGGHGAFNLRGYKDTAQLEKGWDWGILQAQAPGPAVLLSKTGNKDSSCTHYHQNHNDIQLYSHVISKIKKSFSIILSCKEVMD